MLIRILIGIVVLIVAFIGIVFWQAGAIIKQGTERYGPEILHVPVALESADLSFFSGEAALSGFSLGQPEDFGTGTMIGLNNIAMIIRPDTITAEHVIIDSITIDAPLLDARIQDGKSNFEAFTEGLGLPEDAAEEETAPITITVKSLKVTAPELRVKSDGLVAVDEAITLADFELTDLGTDEEGLSPSELARHVMDFIYPQVAKAMIETGLANQIDSLKGKGLDAVKEKLDDVTGEGVREKLDGTIGNLLGGAKKKDKDDEDGSNN